MQIRQQANSVATLLSATTCFFSSTPIHWSILILAPGEHVGQPIAKHDACYKATPFISHPSFQATHIGFSRLCPFDQPYVEWRRGFEALCPAIRTLVVSDVGT